MTVYYFCGCSYSMWLIVAIDASTDAPRMIDLETNETYSLADFKIDEDFEEGLTPPPEIRRRAAWYAQLPAHERVSAARVMAAGDAFARAEIDAWQEEGVRVAGNAFSLAELLIPRRIATEEFGDAMEVIQRIATDPIGRHKRVKILLKVVSTLFWAVWHAIKGK